MDPTQWSKTNTQYTLTIYIILIDMITVNLVFGNAQSIPEKWEIIWKNNSIDLVSDNLIKHAF